MKRRETRWITSVNNAGSLLWIPVQLRQTSGSMLFALAIDVSPEDTFICMPERLDEYCFLKVCISDADDTRNPGSLAFSSPRFNTFRFEHLEVLDYHTHPHIKAEIAV